MRIVFVLSPSQSTAAPGDAALSIRFYRRFGRKRPAAVFKIIKPPLTLSSSEVQADSRCCTGVSCKMTQDHCSCSVGVWSLAPRPSRHWAAPSGELLSRPRQDLMTYTLRLCPTLFQAFGSFDFDSFRGCI
jgi:hypothetical protein